MSVSITASVGVALPAGADDDASALLRDADIAMYRAKDAGRDAEELASPAMRAGASARAQLERALGGALAREEIELYWQPIVAVADARAVRFEALCRWNHPGLGWVSPLEFIPIAEDTGFIVELGRWVLERACAQWAHWRELHGTDSPGVAVNLSPRQLNDPYLLELVAGLTARHRMPPGSLCAEITESALLDAGRSTEQALAGLRSLGVEIELDDFGTGFSSLSSLERFHFDGLKIDRSFVTGRQRDARAGEITEALLAMARTLGLRAVAEGVETAEQLAWLTGAGCELAQGYYFARPQPAAGIDAMIGRHSRFPPRFQLARVHRLDLRGVLLGDRLALELHRRRQLVATGQPVAPDDRELLDLLDAGELRVGRSTPSWHLVAHAFLGRPAPPARCPRCPCLRRPRGREVGVEHDQRGVVGAPVADARRPGRSAARPTSAPPRCSPATCSCRPR